MRRHITEKELRFFARTALSYISRGLYDPWFIESRFNKWFGNFGFRVGKEIVCHDSERGIYWLKLPFLKKGIKESELAIELSKYNSHLNNLIKGNVVVKKEDCLWWNFTRENFKTIRENLHIDREPIFYNDNFFYITLINFGIPSIVFFDGDKEAFRVDAPFGGDFYTACQVNMNAYINKKYGVK